jgi:restriction system protein
MFIGDAKLKTEFSPNVLTGGLTAYIKSFKEVMFDESEVKKFTEILAENKDGQNILSFYKHVKDVKSRYQDNRKCPKCGGELIKRIAKKGPIAGNEFFGCGNYPKC